MLISKIHILVDRCGTQFPHLWGVGFEVVHFPTTHTPLRWFSSAVHLHPLAWGTATPLLLNAFIDRLGFYMFSLRFCPPFRALMHLGVWGLFMGSGSAWWRQADGLDPKAWELL